MSAPFTNLSIVTFIRACDSSEMFILSDFSNLFLIFSFSVFACGVLSCNRKMSFINICIPNSSKFSRNSAGYVIYPSISRIGCFISSLYVQFILCPFILVSVPIQSRCFLISFTRRFSSCSCTFK